MKYRNKIELFADLLILFRNMALSTPIQQEAGLNVGLFNSLIDKLLEREYLKEYEAHATLGKARAPVRIWYKTTAKGEKYLKEAQKLEKIYCEPFNMIMDWDDVGSQRGGDWTPYTGEGRRGSKHRRCKKAVTWEEANVPSNAITASE